MQTDMDMNHTHSEEMDGGVSDPFSRDTAELPDALAPQIVVLQPGDVLELRAEQVRPTPPSRCINRGDRGVRVM